jgi:hypothetical protein
MELYNILQKAHSGWAYLALLILVIVTINSLLGFVSKKEFTPKDRKIALFGLIATHVQLLIGMFLYFSSPNGLDMIKSVGMGALTSASRLLALEHPLVNIIAIVLITMGWSKHKKATTSEAKFKTFAVFYGIGLLLILSRIPWSLWLSK